MAELRWWRAASKTRKVVSWGSGWGQLGIGSGTVDDEAGGGVCVGIENDCADDALTKLEDGDDRALEGECEIFYVCWVCCGCCGCGCHYLVVVVVFLLSW
jgi:hypothetical protein